MWQLVLYYHILVNHLLYCVDTRVMHYPCLHFELIHHCLKTVWFVLSQISQYFPVELDVGVGEGVDEPGVVNIVVFDGGAYAGDVLLTLYAGA